MKNSLFQCDFHYLFLSPPLYCLDNRVAPNNTLYHQVTFLQAHERRGISIYLFIFQQALNGILHCLIHENNGVMDKRCIRRFRELLPGSRKNKEELVREWTANQLILIL